MRKLHGADARDETAVPLAIVQSSGQPRTTIYKTKPAIQP